MHATCRPVSLLAAILCATSLHAQDACGIIDLGPPGSAVFAQGAGELNRIGLSVTAQDASGAPSACPVPGGQLWAQLAPVPGIPVWTDDTCLGQTAVLFLSPSPADLPFASGGLAGKLWLAPPFDALSTISGLPLACWVPIPPQPAFAWEIDIPADPALAGATVVLQGASVATIFDDTALLTEQVRLSHGVIATLGS